jgi:hypothetical protein
MRISEVAPGEKKLQKTLESHHVTLGSLKRKLDEGNFQSINVDLHIPIQSDRYRINRNYIETFIH